MVQINTSATPPPAASIQPIGEGAPIRREQVTERAVQEPSEIEAERQEQTRESDAREAERLEERRESRDREVERESARDEGVGDQVDISV